MKTYGTGPDLRVRREFIRRAADMEEEALEVRELVRGDLEQAGGTVGDGPSRLLVRGQCICSQSIPSLDMSTLTRGNRMTDQRREGRGWYRCR